MEGSDSERSDAGAGLISKDREGIALELSELTSYAEEKYHIQEQRKWAEFPGFSVLADPHTGKWAALLMR